MGNPNWENRTLWTGDNLDIMRGMNSESVDLIYLDPPFNSNRNYSAPIGSEAAGAAFKDTWTLDDVDKAWHGEIADREPSLYAIIDAAGLSHGKGMKSYMIMMAVRLLEMKRLLKPAGSVYLHCDPTASHYLKLLMDTVFGKDSFKNEIIWGYRTGGVSNKWFGRKHDVILFYTGNSGRTHTFNVLKDRSYCTNAPPGFAGVTVYRDDDGRAYTLSSMRDIWEINVIGRNSKERVGYPTQKPLALLDRIIKASSSEGDIILDPFCGCATTLVAAETLDRQWVGIDLSGKAVDLVRTRIEYELGALLGGVIHRTDIPIRDDLGKIPSYKTHKHTLFGRQEGICKGCRVYFPFRNQTIDHVVPQSKGGLDHIDNLQLLCGACNSTKGSKSQAEFIALLKKKGIRE